MLLFMPSPSEARFNSLTEKVFCHDLDLSSLSDTTVTTVTVAASQPDWQCSEDIEVPLVQNSLLFNINEVL